MADGVTFQSTTLASPPAGTEAATDDAGAAGHVQIVKLAVAADGSATVLPADGTVGLGVDIKQAVAIALDAGTLAALETIQVGTSGLPTGASTAAKQDTMIGHLDGVEAALAALEEVGLDAATLAALETITVGSSALPTGASTSAKQDTAQTAFDAIKTAVEVLDNAISGSEIQADIVAALPTGTNTIGKVGLTPQTAGGLTPYHLVSAATTNATVVKASAGQLFGYAFYNSASAARKVAFHNTASAPTAGASIFFTVVVPAFSAANVEFTNGVVFGTGIAFTTVTELTDAGTTAVAANDLQINLYYA